MLLLLRVAVVVPTPQGLMPESVLRDMLDNRSKYLGNDLQRSTVW